MRQLVTFFILAISISGFSQNSIDLANVYWRTSPGNPALNPAGDTGLKRNFNMYVVDAKLPVVLNDDNVLIFGMEYQQNSITFQENPLSFELEYKFASIMLQLGLEHKWNAKSKMLFMAIPRLNTDYNGIDLSHFQLGGLALGTTSRSENFDWKYGLYYNGELFGPMFVPLFGFNWKINDKWRLKTVIPINLELSYQANNWFRTGLRFDGVNGSYKIPPNVLQQGYHLDKADNNAWAFTEFNLGKNVWFHLKAGVSILRKYRFYDDNETLDLKLGPVNIGDDRPTTNTLFENGWSFEARFIYRLPLD
ncbi:MAG: hypothetical protein GQ574_24360 [Crocinitomix sp.]|nr:hypothetical protein [Crocinitomix sp.]